MTEAGPAIPVVAVTDRSADAGPALRVAVVSDGRPVEAGPARPVIVVSDGRPTQGNVPMPIIVATGAQAGRILAGPAIPVVVVSGSLSSAPVNTVLPVISGTLAIGSVLSTTDGTWTNSPISYTYQWKRNGANIGGATANTYTLTASDPGTAITVTVTATNAGGSNSATSAAVNPSSLLTGLAAYWKMDEASGNRADSVGGFTLTDGNTVGSNTGKVSLAADFVGANSESLSVASAAALQAGARDFFFDLWFFTTSVTGVQFLISKGTASSGVGHEYGLFMNGTSLSWRISAGAAQTSLVIANTTLIINTWYYVACWWEQAAGLVWGQLNNNAAVSSALAGTVNTSAAVLSFGAFNAASSFATVRLDEVGRWNRLLTGAEILARYNGGSGQHPPFLTGSDGGQLPLIGGSFTYSSSIES